MKIIHILNAMGPANGIACALVDLACEQSALGHEVFVIAKNGAFDRLLKEHGVTVISIDQTRRPLTILKALRSLNKIISEITPDIVHAHMMTGLILCRLLRPFRKFKLISTVHNEWQKSAILMGYSDKVIVVSNGVKKAMIKRGIPEKKICVVLNGTIGSVRKKNTNTYSPIKRPSITTVAGMFQRKGIPCLIKAFEIVKKDIPTAHLYLIGDGKDKPTFEKQANETGFSKDIHFEGFQPQPEEYLKQTDIFVLASTNEPFGLVLSEARNAGCAVIGSNVGGLPEVLEHGKAGQLFPSGDETELAKIILEMLNDDKKLMHWRSKAQENLEWLTVNRMCKETIDVYASVVKVNPV
jgi:glycosyltransferase involved in cell wall biosynthesis